jgi:predicted RNase H-like nuclease (RuvC/YqgF family)
VSPLEAATPMASASSPSGDVKLGELTQFTEWMQRVVQAIQTDRPVPDQPALGAGLVSTWTQVIRQMDERRREGEVVQVDLDREIQSRDAMVARLTQDLDSSVTELKSMQVICKDLQREVELQKAVVSKTADLSRQVEQFENELKAIASLLSEKGFRLAGLSDTCRDVASMLKSLRKT